MGRYELLFLCAKGAYPPLLLMVISDSVPGFDLITLDSTKAQRPSKLELRLAH